NVEINGQTIASIPRQVTTPLPEIPKPDSVTTNADGTRILLGTEPLPSFPLPLMPGAKIVNVMQVRPSEKSAKTSIPVDAVTYTIEKTAEEVAAFYEPGLKNAGFEVFKTENPSVKGIVLSGRRDKINIAVSALQI